MECGVINEMLKVSGLTPLPPGGPGKIQTSSIKPPTQGPLGEVLDTQMMINDVSGAGNNWAHGNHVYGPQYREQILERVRRTVEACDSIQSFLLLHSLGGGTGSGVGTYILEMLAVSRRSGKMSQTERRPVPPSNDRTSTPGCSASQHLCSPLRMMTWSRRRTTRCCRSQSSSSSLIVCCR